MVQRDETADGERWAGWCEREKRRGGRVCGCASHKKPRRRWAAQLSDFFFFFFLGGIFRPVGRSVGRSVWGCDCGEGISTAPPRRKMSEQKENRRAKSCESHKMAFSGCQASQDGRLVFRMVSGKFGDKEPGFTDRRKRRSMKEYSVVIVMNNH